MMTITTIHKVTATPTGMPMAIITEAAAGATLSDAGLIRLMQLCSVSLPVGGYAFSHGMEYAIEAGWIRNADQVSQWVSEQLVYSLATTDVPVLRRCMAAIDANDPAELQRLNDLLLACRETRELRLTDTAMGEALHRLLTSLNMDLPFAKGEPVSFVCLFALAAGVWGIPYRSAALGLLWSWLENQIAAATKLVPLGQTQAQQLLGALQPALQQALDRADTIDDDGIGAGLPALAIVSSQHEHMYSRLFRS
ncbi:urease accessory protein UreF [Oceanobacter sp. 3_MG-2023]|jgi:urease accessory protein